MSVWNGWSSQCACQHVNESRCFRQTVSVRVCLEPQA
jgi:hypothetical protein